MSDKIKYEELNDSFSAQLKKEKEDSLIQIISQSVQTEELRTVIRECINKDTVYIAKIPKKLEKDFNDGILKFMTDKKTGENLGTIVNGKHKIKGNVRIEEFTKAPDISLNLSNIVIQQQLAEITELLNDVRSRIIVLQQNHDSDLHGRIRGMYDQLCQIRDMSSPTDRKQLINNAITNLNDIRGIIEESIIQEFRNMSLLPNEWWKFIWKVIKDKNYINNINESYDRIESLVSYYLQASQLLGYAYSFLNEKQSFETVFTPFKELFEDKYLNKLKSSERLFNEDLSEAWYNNPDDYMLLIKKEVKHLFIEKNDVIEVELSGNKIYEALKDEKY